MTQNRDDYYSNISENDSPTEKKPSKIKKLKVKKKVTIKAKTPVKDQNNTAKVSDISEKDTPKKIQNQQDNTSKTTNKNEVFLNDAIEKKSKPSSFKVVSRNSHNRAHTTKKDTSEQSSYKTRNSSKSQAIFNNDSSDSKGVKFKAGFSKGKKPSFEKGEERGSKKSTLSGSSREKYKKNFDEETSFRRSSKSKVKKKEEKKIEDIEQNLTSRTGQTVQIGDVLSIKEFSEKIGVPLPKLIAEFMKNGMMMTINSKIDFDTASLIAETFEVTLEREDASSIDIGDLASGNIKELISEEDSSKLESRPPVISIMGHVDHGKTSLLDYIRQAKVADGEAGGITQSIGAYQVESDGRAITFLDTPGHEAFTVMRSRGAKSTDIAVLVVAADEGVKPQTSESISHAKEAGIPVIVAINKMDKEGANPDYVKGQLAEKGLTPEDWGGDTPMIPVSAHTGFGIDELLEIILLAADLLELTANPNRSGVATILESHLDANFGPVSSILVNTGTITKGDDIVCGGSFGKVKVLKDYLGRSVKQATPGMPVLVVGLNDVASGGDILQVVSSVETAKQKSNEYKQFEANRKSKESSQLDILMSRIKSGNLQHLKVVVKADTNGSLEAIKNSLLKLSTDETQVTIIHSGVGDVTQGDVLMCGGSSAILVGFNVGVGPNARGALEESGVEYIESKIIYHITERIEKIVSGMLNPKEVEVELGEAKVGGVFYTSKKFLIVGLIISSEDASIEKDAFVRVLRNDTLVGKGQIETLKQGVEEVKKLEGPIECGIKLVGVDEVLEDDIIEIYKTEIQK